ncbi:hypothetical protein NUSPORA_00926 [Nucleospora cyclopteri]
MIGGGHAKKNSKGKIVKEAEFQSSKTGLARIEPSRNWFTSTKVVTQNELEEYRNSIRTKNPYEVLLSTGNVPYSLINNEVKVKRKYDFSSCFGTKSNPKKPRLGYKNIEDLKKTVKEKNSKEKNSKEEKNKVSGQSKRIWNELYKVLDSSDVVIHVVDARDPLGTKCNQITEYLSKKKHKHLVFVLNKVDLVPTSVTASWLRFLSKKHPAVAYHSNSLENCYGRQNLLNIIRQLKSLYKKKSMSIGFVGYPNCGKSSIINTLRNKKVCSVAPIPGQTKVWQYITLMKEVYLIDSPGIVPISNMKEAILHGAMRVENITDADLYIYDLFKKVGEERIKKTYKLEFEGMDEFYSKFAKRYGKMGKKAEPNIDLIAKTVLHDWLRGKISYYKEAPEE